MRIGIDATAVVRSRDTGTGEYVYHLIRRILSLDKTNRYCLFWPLAAPPTEFDCQNCQNYELGDDQDSSDTTAGLHGMRYGGPLDIYHVPHNGLGVSAGVHHRLIITLFDVIPFVFPKGVPEHYGNAFREQVPEMCRRANAILTVSEYSKNDICQTLGVPAQKVFNIPLAADSAYRPINKAFARDYVRRRYGIAKDYLLYVGGFGERKNIWTVLEGFREVYGCLSRDTVLVLAGKPNATQEKVREFVVRLRLGDKVFFPNLVPRADMPYLYNAARLLVYLSFYEGFGLPPVESMACGTPVIASNAASLPEVVGDGGLLTNPQDVGRLAELLRSVLEDPGLHDALARRALERARAFSWENTAARTLDVYQRVGAGIHA